MNKSYLMTQAEEHLQKFLPKLYKDLTEKGLLEEHLIRADQDYTQAYGEMIESGTLPHEAREILLPQYILLPPEDQTQND